MTSDATENLFTQEGVLVPNANPEFGLHFAQAIGSVLSSRKSKRPVVIGKNTARFNYVIEPAIVSGIVHMGGNIIQTGPIPCPGISALVPALRGDLGIFISGNYQNSKQSLIRVFDEEGNPVSDDYWKEIQHRFVDLKEHLPTDPRAGRAERVETATARYVELVKSRIPRDLRFDGLRVVLDCAHGAAYNVAVQVLEELDVDVCPLNINPNGDNLNVKSGYFEHDVLKRHVRDMRADIGIAFNGDGDAVSFSDENGILITAPQIDLAFTTYWKWNGTQRLADSVVRAIQLLYIRKYLDTSMSEIIKTLSES